MKETLNNRIIEFLAAETDKFYSISDIAKMLGVAYSHAHLFISRLSNEGIVRIQKIGNVSVCRLETKNMVTQAHLALMEAKKTQAWLAKNPHADNILEKISLVQDNVHCILLRNNQVIVVAPERIAGADYSMFKNRSVITAEKLERNSKQYKDCVVLHGAAKYWNIIGGR
jgi:transposase